MTKLTVQVWSDLACPWCYVGKRHLEEAVAQVATPIELEVRFRSFELDPSLPRQLNSSKTYAERLAAKYGNGVAAAQAMIDKMTKLGSVKDIQFRFEAIGGGNTFLAHQLLHWAATQALPSAIDESLPGQGAQSALKERLMRAYFCEGAGLGEPDELVRLAGSIGLDEEGAHNALSSGSFAQNARDDEGAAQELRISGVPFFVIGRYGVSGAQPGERLAAVITKAWEDQADELGESPGLPPVV